MIDYRRSVRSTSSGEGQYVREHYGVCREIGPEGSGVLSVYQVGVADSRKETAASGLCVSCGKHNGHWPGSGRREVPCAEAKNSSEELDSFEPSARGKRACFITRDLYVCANKILQMGRICRVKRVTKGQSGGCRVGVAAIVELVVQNVLHELAAGQIRGHQAVNVVRHAYVDPKGVCTRWVRLYSTTA